MTADQPYSLDSARAAAREDALADWVTGFLASPGSDNAALAARLAADLGWWVGPVALPLDRLHRLAGPPGDPVHYEVDESFWDERVTTMSERAGRGWDPPPVIASYRDGRLFLEDGNHRVESLRRAGRGTAWVVVGFERREDRDGFATRWLDPAGRDPRGGPEPPCPGVPKDD